MPSLPYVLSGKCTKADDSAYTGTVWVRNQTEDQTLTTTCNSVGDYAFDLANFGSYLGDVFVVAIEAYENPNFVLRRDAFEDDSSDTMEFEGQKLHMAVITMNFKIIGDYETARVKVFNRIYDQLNQDPPTYVRDSTTYTYSILSAFPQIAPVYPCIVVNPVDKSTTYLGVGKRPNASRPGSVEIEFYVKVSHGKNAIDTARDKVELLLGKNWITETFTQSGEGGTTVNIQGVE